MADTLSEPPDAAAPAGAEQKLQGWWKRWRRIRYRKRGRVASLPEGISDFMDSSD